LLLSARRSLWRSRVGRGRISRALLWTLDFRLWTLPSSYDTNSQRQSGQWVGRRCCAAGYDGRAATRPYRLEYVPIIIRKWYDLFRTEKNEPPHLSSLRCVAASVGCYNKFQILRLLEPEEQIPRRWRDGDAVRAVA